MKFAGKQDAIRRADLRVHMLWVTLLRVSKNPALSSARARLFHNLIHINVGKHARLHLALLKELGSSPKRDSGIGTLQTRSEHSLTIQKRRPDSPWPQRPTTATSNPMLFRHQRMAGKQQDPHPAPKLQHHPPILACCGTCTRPSCGVGCSSKRQQNSRAKGR